MHTEVSFMILTIVTKRDIIKGYRKLGNFIIAKDINNEHPLTSLALQHHPDKKSVERTSLFGFLKTFSRSPEDRIFTLKV